MYKYVLNSVVKIPMMFAKYFEYYTIILRGAVFSWTRCIICIQLQRRILINILLTTFIKLKM